MTRYVVDAHVHVWERNRHPQPWIDQNGFAAISRDFPPSAAAVELAGNGVSGGVVVQCLNESTETIDLLADAARTDAIRGVVGWVDLTGDVEGQIEALRASAGGRWLVGVRHVTFEEPDVRWLARDDVQRGLAALGRLGVTYDVLVGHHQLPLVAEVARAHPAVSFVLNHLGKVPMRSPELVTWARGLAALARHDNVVVKVSGVVTEDDWGTWSVDRLRPVFEHALEAFGPGRLLFGSDWPVVGLAATYGQWLDAYGQLTADLTAEERAGVDGRNAERVYRLA